MAQAAQDEARYTVEQYFGLVTTGELHPDDRVELLEGVIVAMVPQNPKHASGTTLVYSALREAIGRRAVIRVQLPLVLGRYSAPEPDAAVVPGTPSDYYDAHPTTALLIVEVADSSLAQDRLTKAAIYAAAGIPEYWLVNLQDQCVEVFRRPEPSTRCYSERFTAPRGTSLDITALAGASVLVDDLLPGSD